MPQRGAAEVGDLTFKQDFLHKPIEFSGKVDTGFNPSWTAGTGWKPCMKWTVITNKTGILDADIRTLFATDNDAYGAEVRVRFNGVQKTYLETTSESYVSCVLDFEEGVLKDTTYEVILDCADDGKMTWYLFDTPDWVADFVVS
ncbi:hypothetical protein ES702_04502 [subsurface metagenome]